MLAALLLGGAPGNAAGLSIPVLGADSAYSLQEAAPDDTNKITVYQTEEVIKYYDKLTGQEIQEGQLQPDIEYNQVSSIALAPQDYSLTLNKTVYGDVENHNEADNMYYKFSVDDAGNVNMNLSDSSDYDILYHVSNVINKSDRLTANDANDQLYDTFDISENFISLVTEGKPYDPYYDDGGAIYNDGDLLITNSNFFNNHADCLTGSAQGGAIYAKNDLMVNAEDGFTSIFSGNYVEDKDGKRDEAIYAASGAVLGLNTTTGGQIYMNDKINGAKGYTLSLKGDDTGKITFNNSVLNANIMTNTGSNVYLTRENLWDNNSFQANGGTLSFVNNSIGISQLSGMTVTQDTNFIADVNLETKEMDRFTAGSYGEHTGNLNVIGMNLLNDAPEGQDVTAVYFAEPGLKNNVSNGMGELPNSFQTTAYTPIYKYNVTYDNENEYDYTGRWRRFNRQPV